MKNQIESVLEVYDKVDSCPVCGGKLRKESSRVIGCLACGFKIIVRTRKTDEQFGAILAMFLLVIFGLGFVLGFGLGVS